MADAPAQAAGRAWLILKEIHELLVTSQPGARGCMRGLRRRRESCNGGRAANFPQRASLSCRDQGQTSPPAWKGLGKMNGCWSWGTGDPQEQHGRCQRAGSAMVVCLQWRQVWLLLFERLLARHVGALSVLSHPQQLCALFMGKKRVNKRVKSYSQWPSVQVATRNQWCSSRVGTGTNIIDYLHQGPRQWNRVLPQHSSVCG